MKKIRTIKDLEFENLKLRVKQLELEKQMQGSWKKLVHKISFEDTSKQKRAEQTNIHNKTGNPVLTGVLSYGAGFISHKLGMLAGKKVESLAEQVLENFFDKIKAAISKRKKR